MKELSIMHLMISVNVKMISLIRSVILNALLALHPNTLTLKPSNVSAASRGRSLIRRFSNVFAQQQTLSKPIHPALAVSCLNSLIILIRHVRIVKRTLSTIPRISNAGDALRISLYLSWIDALLALKTNISILVLRIANSAPMVETLTKIRIFVNVLLKHLSILMWNVSLVSYPNISTFKQRNVEIVQLI